MTNEIELTEYEQLQYLSLDVAQRDLLASRIPELRITPAEGHADLYNLTPGSVVGSFQVGDLSVVVRPKIGIQKLLFLACYSMGAFDLHEGEWHWFKDADTLPDAMSLSLSMAARRAFEQGLLYGYRRTEESLYTVRGRIRMGEQLKRRFSMPFPIEVQYDEYTEDVIENQLVRAAAWCLGRMRLRSQKARDGLREITARLGNVSLVEFSPADVPEVTFDRLNVRYKEAVMLSRLVLRRGLFESTGGTVPAPGFHMDMDKVFQGFVTQALREALGVSERTLLSDVRLPCPIWLDRTHGNRGCIALRPDLTWWDGSRYTFVADAKYKHIRTSVPNADLYQLLAYATALDLPGGLLIYAKGERPPHSYSIPNAEKRLDVAEIDLAGDVEGLLRRMGQLAERVRCIRDA